MSPLVMPMIVAAIVIPIVLWNERKKRARIELAKQLATQYGFVVDTDTKPPPQQQFDLFGTGKSKKVSFQFWRDGESDSVFQYQYTTGSGDNQTTHRRSCALVSLPFGAPHTKLGPEGFWSGLGRMVGVRDIEVESAAFNDQYRVTSDDERFAVTFLDQQMIAWLLSSQSGRGEIKFELWGDWLLCISDQMELAQLFGFLDWAQGVRAHMPTVLPSLYPPGRPLS